MATFNSTEYAAQNSSDKNRSQLNVREVTGKLRYAEINITFVTGVAAGDQINLISLPSKHKLMLMHTFFKLNASWGAGAAFDVGYRAWTKEDGTVVAEDDDAVVNEQPATVTTRTAITEALQGVAADVIGQVKIDGLGGDIDYFLSIRVDPPVNNDTMKILLAYIAD